MVKFYCINQKSMSNNLNHEAYSLTLIIKSVTQMTCLVPYEMLYRHQILCLARLIIWMHTNNYYLFLQWLTFIWQVAVNSSVCNDMI